MAEEMSGGVVDPRRGRVVFGALLFFAYFGLNFAAATAKLGSSAGWIAIGLAGAAALLLDLRSLFGWKPVIRPAQLRIDTERGTVERAGSSPLTRDATGSVEVREVGGKLLVDIEDSLGKTTLAFRSRKNLTRLLAAIAPKGGSTVPVVVMPSRVAALPTVATVLAPLALVTSAVLATVISVVLRMPTLLPAATVSLGVLGALRGALALLPTRLCVRGDGIEWRWGGAVRTLPYERIASAQAVEARRDDARHAIEVVTTEGRRLVFATDGKLQQRFLLSRLDRGLRTASSGHDALAYTLRRAGRSTEDWVAYLRSVGGGANAGPRVAAVPSDALERLARDPHALARDRAAATVALGRATDPTSLDRVRIAVEGSTVPALQRVVAASGAEDDDAALVEALAELDHDAVADPQHPGAAHLEEEGPDSG